MNSNSPPLRRPGRPPRLTEDGADTRERLLRAGVEVLTEKGFVATGLDEVLRSVGVPKGSFYHYFSSKEAFGAALIARYGEYFARKLERHLGDATKPPLERLAGFMADAREGMARFDYRRGCLVGNLGQEAGALPEPYRPLLQAVLEDWEQRVRRCLEEARACSDVPVTLDCAQSARYFWIGWEGAVMRARLERRPDALDIFGKAFLDGLQAR